ncbi:phage portal protein [Stappia sp. WLB 29]|uniref:phage portal protein n=1 Tax=Stappia sp. WLB 29 TaxID=2925220 RepID=UPI0020BFC309|nr:phage portal protein [Stappia sp. WLB 29]
MAFWSNWFGARAPADAASRSVAPRNAVQDRGGGVLITTPEELEEVMRSGRVSASGATVTPETAMRVAAVFACVRLRSGVVANLPLHIKRRVDERTREDAHDHPLWTLFRRRPNRWQTPSQFMRMMQAHLLLRGNAFAQVVRSRGRVIALHPLHPDRMQVKQLDDLSLTYTYTRRDGRKVAFAQSDIFHLVGLSLDGVTGVSVIRYARETIGLSLTMEDHGGSMFRNAARTAGALTHPEKLSPEALENLRASLDSYRAGGDSEGKFLILEEGMEPKSLSMTAEDAQWIESRKFSRTDIAMFFGVPPHMIGDTEKSTSWGTGVEAQTQGFVTFGAEDDFTTWEQTITAHLVGDDEPDVYARFNRAALVRGDLKARWEAHVRALQWGVSSPNEIRALEDQNPREGGDVYYDPPNAAGIGHNGGPPLDEEQSS